MPRVLLAAFLSAGTVASQQDVDAARPKTWRVIGRAVDELGVGIEGAGLLHAGKLDLDVERVYADPTGRSKSDGTFDVEIPAQPTIGGTVVALLGAKGRSSRWIYLHKATSSRTIDLGRVVLPKGVTLVGIVQDENRKPIAGAHVEAREILTANHLQSRFGNLTTGHYATFAKSNAKGIFKLRGVLRPGAEVTVRAKGFHLGRINFAHPMESMSVQLTAGGFVSGRVVDENGKPTECMIRVLSEQGEDHLLTRHTKKDGTFRCNLPFPGRYRVAASPKHGSNVNNWAFSDILDGAQKDVTVTLQGSGLAGKRIVVRVVDAKTGAKVTKFRAVCGFVPTQTLTMMPGYLDTLMHSRGRDQMQPGLTHLPGPNAKEPGVGRLLVRAKGYAPATLDDVGIGSGAGDDENEFDVKLAAESSILGVVVDTDTDEPVVGAAVRAEKKIKAARGMGAIRVFSGSSFFGTRPTVSTDAKGRFRIGQLAKGEYTIHVTHPMRPATKKRSVEVAAGETLADVSVRIRRGSTINGTLTGVKIGKGWQVRLNRGARQSTSGFFSVSSSSSMNSGQKIERLTQVAADGTFRFEGLSRGSYQGTLLIPGSGVADSEIEVPLKSVRVRREDRDWERDLSTSMPGKLTGKIIWKGAALPPGRVILVARKRQKNADVFTGFEGTGVSLTGAKALVQPNGRFQLKLASGRFDLRAFDLRTGVQLYQSENPIRVESATTLELDLEFTLALVRVILEPESEGKPVVATRLQIEARFPKLNQRAMGRVIAMPQHDLGGGLRLSPGQTEVELFVPNREIAIKVRSGYHNLYDGQHRHTVDPVGETDFEPEMGKSTRVKITISNPQ